ncbi:MAG: alginate export family protein, partial [Planctomycetes bacterium]|nr:alginate export family protein [Planctomycetota bacterium]
MNRSTFMTIVLCFATSFCGLARAQNDENLIRELEKVRTELRDIHHRQAKLELRNEKLEADNLALRSLIEDRPDVEALESRINALIGDAASFAGTTVDSTANPIKISGEARVRAAYTSNRDFGLRQANQDFADDNGTFVDARFNLAFDFTFDRHIATHFELIAAGLFDNGATDHNSGNLDEVDLYQGWILMTHLFGNEALGLRTGRQEIVLGNEFHFGNNDFFDGETFDSTLVWWNDDNFRLIFVWAKLDVNNSYNPSNHPYAPVGAGLGAGHDDDEAYVLYFTLKTIKDHELDLYYAYWNGHRGVATGTLGNPVGAGFDIFANVVGGRLGGTFDVAAGLDYDAEISYMFGDLSGTSIDVDGLTAEVTVGITFNKTNLARLYAMFLYAEGFDGNDSGWVPLFPERHQQTNWDDHTDRMARWGLTDIVPMINVYAFQLGFTFRPNDNWIVGAAGIAAFHDEDVAVNGGGQDDGIGWEVDLFAEHRMSDQATLG